MHTICSPLGDVLRIMVNKKQGVQAFIEFADVESARKAKQTLNGCDVYSGCCTLKIDFARVSLLCIDINGESDIKNGQNRYS